MADMDELDLAVAAQRVDDRIESVPDNPIAAFDARVREHLPQHVRDIPRHRMIPFWLLFGLELSHAFSGPIR